MIVSCNVIVGSASFGKEIEICEILSTFNPIFIEINVHKINARICDGTYLFHLFGNPKTIMRAVNPSKKASIFIVCKDCSTCSMLSIVLE